MLPRRLRNRFRNLGRSIRMMEPPSAFAARKAGPPDKICRFPGEKIFEISSSLSRALPDEESKVTLHRRLRSYAYTKRRGRLRLPAYFPAEVRALSDLSKRQIREIMYWVRPSTGLNRPLSKWTFQYVRQHSAVPVWNRLSGADSHTANVVGLHRLRKTDAPSCGRALWPSAPSFTEMMELNRRGVSPLSVHKTPSITVKDCLTRKAISDDIRVARKIVAKYIVGIRSSVEIPEQFLPWFRYRFGFSILSTRYTLPSGLVRFLLAQWKIRHTNLWLVDHCSLKIFLRKHSAVEFVKDKLDTAGSVYTETVYSEGPGVSSPSTIAPRVLPDEELLAGLGDEFAELLARLPS